MYQIPTELLVGEQSFTIRNRGDFRMVLDCFLTLEDAELTKEERIIACLIIFYEEFQTPEDVLEFENLDDAVTKMYWFFNCGQEHSPGMNTPYKLIDWDHDSQMICSAINNVANTEIRLEPYIHWWTFMGYYMAVGESTLSTVVGIRNKLAKGKTLEKHEQQFRKDNPQYFTWNARTVQQQDADEIVKQLWNSGE